MDAAKSLLEYHFGVRGRMGIIYRAASALKIHRNPDDGTLIDDLDNPHYAIGVLLREDQMYDCKLDCHGLGYTKAISFREMPKHSTPVEISIDTIKFKAYTGYKTLGKADFGVVRLYALLREFFLDNGGYITWKLIVEYITDYMENRKKLGTPILVKHWHFIEPFYAIPARAADKWGAIVSTRLVEIRVIKE